MNIYINARFLTQPTTGVQRYAIECCRQIKKLYANAIFISPKNIIHYDIAEELNVVKIGRNKGHIWEQLDLMLYMNKLPDHPPLLNLANTAPIRYAKIYLTLHDLAFYHHPEWNSTLFAEWYNYLTPLLLQKSKHVFTVSETIKKEIIIAYDIPPSKISVTYNGVSPTLSHKVSPSTKKEKIILTVGTISQRKNQELLIKAFLQSEIKKGYRLVIIGDKNKIFSETEIKESSLINEPILFIQNASEKELLEWYQKAEIIASLSKYEGFGIPILEGLFSGCKVLCSEIPVYVELFNEVATFCDIANLNDIVNKLNRLPFDGKLPDDTDLKQLSETYNYEKAAKMIMDKVMEHTILTEQGTINNK